MNSKALEEIKASLKLHGGGVVIVQNVDAIRYLTGFTGFLSSTRQQTMVIVGDWEKPTIFLPACEAQAAKRALGDCVNLTAWTDDAGGWWPPLSAILTNAHGGVGIESNRIHSSILNKLNSEAIKTWDATSVVDALRSVKTPKQCETMAKAGQVAIAILDAARHAMAVGKEEWQIALAATNAGSEKAAGFLREEFENGDPAWEHGESPLIAGDIPILNSAHPGCKELEDDMLCVHRRASMRRLRPGDSVYLCCCNVAEYRGMHVGFDRTFFMGPLSNELKRVHDLCVEMQEAALQQIRPGVICEDVNAAALAVIQKAGLSACYRTGRSLGFSILEAPELRSGDKTPLAEGMCFAVDGGVEMPGVGTVRIGDTVCVTADGYKCLTPYEKGPIVIPVSPDPDRKSLKRSADVVGESDVCFKKR